MLLLDCEQSLFFFRFSESSACMWELLCLAFSHLRGHLRVSRGLQKKERLLVVYGAFILPIQHFRIGDVAF